MRRRKLPLLIAVLVVSGPAWPQAEPAHGGKSVSGWVAQLKGAQGPGKLKAQADAVTALSAIGAPAVPALIGTLKDPSSDVRRSSCDALKAIGPPADSAIPALIETLRDASRMVRMRAAEALGYVGPGAKAAVPSLAEALKDPDQWVRNYAAQSLGRIGPDAAPAVAGLVAALQDQGIRHSAIQSLEKIGPAAAEPAVPALIELVRSPGEPTGPEKSASGRYVPSQGAMTRVLAIKALGAMGPRAKAAIPALNGARKDEDPSVRYAAEDVLRKLQGK